MRTPSPVSTLREGLYLAAALAVVVACGLAPVGANADEHAGAPEISFDGLERVQDARLALVYVDPDADFSVYERIMILPVFVAFERRWEREQRRLTGSTRNQIKERVAEEFQSIFRQELEEKGGYPIVEEPGEDVLLLRPAVINLRINAIDQHTAGRSTTWVANSGQATLYVEVFDSTTSHILARAADTQVGRRRGGSWGFRGGTPTNIADMRAALRVWAGALREALDEVHGRFSE